ncbi:MAG: single-stranded-DNA-specific exonuclease RecJ, partial [Bacteroidetes bacterium 4572_77]
HHEPGDILPDVFEIIDPLKPNSNYPFTGLAACGVAFKICHAISIRLGREEEALKYLDFVALASVADSVPLVDENRILVSKGLEMMNTELRPGLKGLLYCTGFRQGVMTTTNIVFGVAPLINAAGRLGDAGRSVELMMQNNEIAAFRIAQELEEENRRRRIFDTQTLEAAIPIAEKQLEDETTRVLVIHHDDWHAGVIGVVASRLVERYNMPAILMTTFAGHAKGSARSISSFDIHSAIKTCSDLMLEFGGHTFAAGLSMEIKDVPELRRRINEYAKVHLTREMLEPEILIDADLKLDELSPKFFKTLAKFAPYGFSNRKPVFYTDKVETVNGIKVYGENNFKCRVKQNNFVIDAVGQNLAHKLHYCTKGNKFKIVYNLEELNTSHGPRLPQINMLDIMPVEEE